MLGGSDGRLIAGALAVDDRSLSALAETGRLGRRTPSTASVARTSSNAQREITASLSARPAAHILRPDPLLAARRSTFPAASKPTGRMFSCGPAPLAAHSFTSTMHGLQHPAESGLETAQAPCLSDARAGASIPAAMSEPLRLTIVYEDAGDGDGWVVARIPQVRGAISQGATRAQAHQNVIDALRELLAVRFGSPPELPEPGRQRLA